MTKRILYTIIIGMGVSLLGIIWVQLYWIDNARTVKEAQFDHHVSLALNASVESLDQREQVFFLKRQITSPEGGRIVRTQVANNGETVEDVTKWVIQCVGKDGHVLAECNDTGTCILTHANDQKVRREQVHRSRRVRVVAGSDSLQEERNIEMVVRASEDDTLQFNQVMGKMVREFRRRSDPLKSKLAGINLQKVLATDLKNHGIDLPFEYAVVNRDHIVEEYSSAGFAIEELESCYRIDLFKGDIVNHPGELVLLFSGKHSWVFSKMWFMLMASLLFTGIIVLTFACTVYYLIKQKKLADIKNDFIDNMTHEFKTPISTISLALDSITHPKVRGNTERVEQYAEIIRQENRRMNSQVESVLNTALAERRELNLDEKEIDIHQIINKLCDRMQLSFQSNGGSLTLDLKATSTVTLGDEMHLHNVLSNLVDNGVKYSEGSPRIHISTADAPNGFTITVEDQGMGMSAETKRKAFEKFFRQQSGNLHTVKGFGIGLSYVKAIVEAHQGSVSIDSVLGQGTAVHITLPSKFKMHAETA